MNMFIDSPARTSLSQSLSENLSLFNLDQK